MDATHHLLKCRHDPLVDGTWYAYRDSLFDAAWKTSENIASVRDASDATTKLQNNRNSYPNKSVMIGVEYTLLPTSADQATSTKIRRAMRTTIDDDAHLVKRSRVIRAQNIPMEWWQGALKLNLDASMPLKKLTRHRLRMLERHLAS